MAQSRHTIRYNAGTRYTESASYGDSRLTVNPASDSSELAHVTISLAGHLTRCARSRQASPQLVSLSDLKTADSNILEVGHRLPQTLLKYRRMAWAACLEKAYDIHVEFADHCIAWLWQVGFQGLDHAAQRSPWDADCTVMHLHMHTHVTQKGLALQCKTLLRLLYVKLEGSMPCLPEQQHVSTVNLLMAVSLQTTSDSTAHVCEANDSQKQLCAHPLHQERHSEGEPYRCVLPGAQLLLQRLALSLQRSLFALLVQQLQACSSLIGCLL